MRSLALSLRHKLDAAAANCQRRLAKKLARCTSIRLNRVNPVLAQLRQMVARLLLLLLLLRLRLPPAAAVREPSLQASGKDPFFENETRFMLAGEVSKLLFALYFFCLHLNGRRKWQGP